jgi:hypothetical protein
MAKHKIKFKIVRGFMLCFLDYVADNLVADYETFGENYCPNGFFYALLPPYVWALCREAARNSCKYL